MFKVRLPAAADEMVVSCQLHKVSGVFFERSNGKIVNLPDASNETATVSVMNVSVRTLGTSLLKFCGSATEMTIIEDS